MKNCLPWTLMILAVPVLPVAGQTVVDGDTIKLDSMTYRLWGIDAAEMHQACADGWPAGVEATNYLRTLMRDRKISCEARALDRYRRTVALCRADSLDLGAELVRVGMAWAFTRYSSDYVGEERDALRRGVGVGAGNPTRIALKEMKGEQTVGELASRLVR